MSDELVAVQNTLQFRQENNVMEKPPVFITGGTGYMGSRLIKKLLLLDYHVIALVRKGSEHKLPNGAEPIVGNPFDARSFAGKIPVGSIYVQLLGVPHPSPKKANLFKEIDLQSVKISADAASLAGVSHFIYVSVAQSPSKIMRTYQGVRKQGEEYCIQKGLTCTFIRPWYVLGPGHWWPVLLLPVYGLSEIIPGLRPKARSKALVTIRQMLRTLVNAVEEKPASSSIIEIKGIRSALDNVFH